MTSRSFLSLLKEAGSQWVDDKAPRLGAALAYYALFSLAPMCIIIISVAGLVYGETAAQGTLLEQIRGLVGEQVGSALQTLLAGANRPAEGAVAGLLSLGLLLFGATSFFAELQDALNTIWGVSRSKGQRALAVVKERFLAFIMVLFCGLLLLASLALSTLLSCLGEYVGDWQRGIVGHFFSFLVSFVLMTLLFAVIYHVLPQTSIAWRHVWLGAAVTSFLFNVGQILIGLYLGQSAVASSYGAIGSLAVILVWLYYAAQIFLFGAELTKVHAHGRTHRADSREQ